MREAEQRHLQIMNEVLQGLRNEWNSGLVQKDQECEQRVQDAESEALAAKNAAKERSEEIEASLATNQATYGNRIGELRAEANKLHNLKLDEERKRITKEFEASYAQTVEEAQQAIATATWTSCLRQTRSPRRRESWRLSSWVLARTNGSFP